MLCFHNLQYTLPRIKSADWRKSLENRDKLRLSFEIRVTSAVTFQIAGVYLPPTSTILPSSHLGIFGASRQPQPLSWPLHFRSHSCAIPDPKHTLAPMLLWLHQLQ